jgi:hypothetical protein
VNHGHCQEALGVACNALLLPLNAPAVHGCTVKVHNVSSDYMGVSPATFAMWATMLQHIKLYDGEGTCAMLPTYGNASVPVYIGNMR